MSESPAQQFALGSLLKEYIHFSIGVGGYNAINGCVEEQKEYLWKRLFQSMKKPTFDETFSKIGMD